MYYRGAALALLVYDVTDRKSFESVKSYVKGKNFLIFVRFENVKMSLLIFPFFSFPS